MKMYFIFLMMFCFGMMGVFALLGSKGILGPLSTITGIVMSIAGAIGFCIDMKSVLRKLKNKNT